MDRIYKAAEEGDVSALKNLLQQDSLLLDKLSASCHAETPLHIASMLGHTQFVKEILNAKPELAGHLDARGSLPLHLATAKGYLDIVKILLSVNPDAFSVRNRDGRNPLHIAAIKGHIHVLKELIKSRSSAARMKTNRNETIFHLCVRYNQLQVMELLLESINDSEFMNSKDEDGNNILHVAVAEKQIQAIKILTENTTIELNALNAYGFTPLDLSTQSRKDVNDWEISELLQRLGAVNAKDIGSSSHRVLPTKKPDRVHEEQVLVTNWLKKMSNGLMVVASLIATMAFQVGVNPPGGVWEEDGPNDPNRPPYMAPQRAGHSVLDVQDSTAFEVIMLSNTIAFVASLSSILMLISGLTVKNFMVNKIFTWVLMFIMWIAISATAVTYLFSIESFSDSFAIQKVSRYTLVAWIGVLALFLLLHIIRIIIRFLAKVISSRKIRR